MEELSLDGLRTLAENAYSYLNTAEGVTNVIVGASTLVARWLLATYGIPVAKVTLTGVKNLFSRTPSPILSEVLKSLDDPQAILNESATNSFDELLTNSFVVKYDKEAIRSVTTSGRNVLDVLTEKEKRQVTKKLIATVSRVKLRDWTNQREDTLRLLASDVCKSDATRRV